MPLSDTRIHQTELLLTLDYLLRYTDDNHPATQQDICRHATNFGLKYDPKNQKGNDVKRQRIGDCLKFLMDVTEKFCDEVPFVLERTDSGKYYIEQKHYLSEEQVLKILAAVKNDKYTQDEDTDFLIDRLLDSLSSVHNRDRYKKELKDFDRGVKKYNLESNRKIRLVNKAFNQKKMLKIRLTVYSKVKADAHVYDFWYRVYKIKDFGGKPYAILIPIDTGDVHFSQNFKFDAIENLNIPKGSDKDVLMDDFDENRDLNKLFEKKWKLVNWYYGSPEKIFEKGKRPVGGIPFKTSFYFRKVFLKFVKPSFEEFFSTTMKYEECSSFDVVDMWDVTRLNDKYYISPHPLKPGEKAEYCVVNTFIDAPAFYSWILGDVHGNGTKAFTDIVNVVGPKRINKWLYEYYLEHAKKQISKLSPEDVERINQETDKYI